MAVPAIYGMIACHYQVSVYSAWCKAVYSILYKWFLEGCNFCRFLCTVFAKKVNSVIDLVTSCSIVYSVKSRQLYKIIKKQEVGGLVGGVN